MKLKKYELRLSLSKNLYDYISKEATNRYTTMAAITREKLAAYALSQEKHVPTHEQDNASLNEMATSMQQTEKRLLSTISKIEKLLALTEDRLQLLILMVNYFYLDLMIHIPNIPEELRPGAIAMGKRRHSTWLEKIGIRNPEALR